MNTSIISGGVVHDLPSDLEKALTNNPVALAAWEKITPLARNEWICWILFVKQQKTRDEHVERACTQLIAGKRRPCCWVGCINRTDKPVSAWAQKVLIDKEPKPIKSPLI